MEHSLQTTFPWYNLLMDANALIPGRIYLDSSGGFGEFSRIGGTGLAICHPPGEPDMQSSWAIDPSKIVREATEQEANDYKRQCNYTD